MRERRTLIGLAVVIVTALALLPWSDQRVQPVTRHTRRCALVEAGYGAMEILEVAIRACPDGSLIELGIGTFVYTNPITISKPLTLSGSEVGRTVFRLKDELPRSSPRSRPAVE